ncbi:histidine phosphatase family protein [Terriglobus roseus]|uniref:Probable phosphoglycerate mutase n=1 Tax=Terriglobus roseus TaxID=392734 RepID=A0A1G7N2M4_9BACT|nr:histidine phosphatase family protein [Terriglobus roseus]SDF68325.1 probable phosphoglycerate mutase [Terriglobus roseus]
MTEQKKKQAELWLFRHGETEWSLNGKHTSYTDLPLTEHGREQATALAPVIAKTQFDLVLTSPRQRARDTAALAGLGNRAEVEPNLQEWNYGVYEGKSTPEIQAAEPGWSVWDSPITGGESIDQVAARAQQVIDRCLQHGGRCALFAHAHIFRILAAVWAEQPGVFGQRLALSTATVSVLGWEHGTRVITRWNAAP